jgi:N-acetyl-gamma-glutamyl-phosphate reductase
MQQRTSVAICGAQGYSGQALTKLVLQHPHLQLAGVFSRRDAAEIYRLLPQLAEHHIPIWPMKEFHDRLATIDVLLLATPAATSMELATAGAEHVTHVIDLSGAFRLPPDSFAKWYGIPHSAPELLDQAIYGLLPWWQTHASNSHKTRLIANPGCYATCSLMALLPLIKQNILQTERIIIDAKSGVSGAGRAAKESLLFCEVADNFFPYKIGQHQHTPEIQHTLEQYTGQSVQLTLTTHLLPIVRGISLICYAQAQSRFNNDSAIEEAVEQAYRQAYQDYPLVTFSRLNQAQPQQHLLAVNQVAHTPNTHIVYYVQQGQLIIAASLDNLLKGAASQAIENINALYTWPLTTGLWPQGEYV